MTGASRKAGWSPEPAVTHSEIVDLLYGLSADDPRVPDTWKYQDRYLTSFEQFIVRTASDAAWADAQALRDIDGANNRAKLDWLRFILRSRYGVDPDSTDA